MPEYSETQEHHRLKALSNKFFQESLIKDLEKKISSDPGSRVAFITVTFNKERFQGKLRGYSGSARSKAICGIAPDLFETFRGFYLRMMRACIPNFTRPSKRSLQPQVVAFIDDADGLSPYPHIHAIAFLPSGVAEEFKEWVFRGRHIALWKELQSTGTIEITAADTSPSDLANKTRYSAKYWFRETIVGATSGEELLRLYPDQGEGHQKCDSPSKDLDGKNASQVRIGNSIALTEDDSLGSTTP
jgi:hypothetical protein